MAAQEGKREKLLIRAAVVNFRAWPCHQVGVLCLFLNAYKQEVMCHSELQFPEMDRSWSNYPVGTA